MGWLVKNAMCISCGHQWVAVYQEDVDETKLQCSSCMEQHSITVAELSYSQ